MKKFFLSLLAAITLLATHSQGLISTNYNAAYFPIVSVKGPTAIYVDPKDHWLVRKAAALLQADIEMVTGRRPALLSQLPTNGPLQDLIIIGSLDSSSLIKNLGARNLIPADRLSGKWESFQWKTIEGSPKTRLRSGITGMVPSLRCNRALIIAGSDRRGTAYGVFEQPSLPTFNPFDREKHSIDIFQRATGPRLSYVENANPLPYTITSSDPWVLISRARGTINWEDRIFISIDWTKAPTGKKTSTLTITGRGDSSVSVKLNIDNPATPRPQQVKGFVETNGYLSIEAEHFSKAVASPTIKWQIIPDLGRTLSGVEAEPVTAPTQTPGGNSPHLEYNIYLFDTGSIRVQSYFSPILEFNRHPIHYGISIDNEPPQIIDLSTGNEAKGTWDKMVSDNIRIALSTHSITRPGQHTLKFWLVDPAVVLQKIVVDAGGVLPSYLGPPESFHSK